MKTVSQNDYRIILMLYNTRCDTANSVY